MAQRILEHIRNIFFRKTDIPHYLEMMARTHKNSQEGKAEGKATHSRTSGRIRKNPVPKSDDSLWASSVIKLI